MIRVENLTKTFETDTTDFIAVDNLSFQGNPGEVYGLLGPNGAGKTTTMRMVLGLMQPTEGFAEVEGFRSSDSPDEVKRRIGFVSATAGTPTHKNLATTCACYVALSAQRPTRLRLASAGSSQLTNIPVS